MFTLRKKTKVVRGTDAPFANEQLRKAIYTRTRLKNNILKNPSIKNKMGYKKQRNFCVSLRRKCMKNYLKKLTEKGLTTNKSFWKFMKPFLTNKGFSFSKLSFSYSSFSRSFIV